MVGVIGGLVLAMGIVLIVLPGPAFIVIPAGLGILATEYRWAQKLRDRVRDRFDEFRRNRRMKKAAASRGGSSLTSPSRA